MKFKKILLVLTLQPLTLHNFTRLGVNTKFKNWQIIHWCVLPLFNFNIYKSYTSRGSRHLKNKNFKEILTYFKLIKELKNLPSNFFYLNLTGDNFTISILDRCLNLLGGKKIKWERGPDIDLKFHSSKLLREYLKKNNLKKIIYRSVLMAFKKIRDFLSKLISNGNALMIFVCNSYKYENIKKKETSSNLFKLDGPEFELFLKAKKKKSKKKSNIVFIDDVVEGSFDYKLNYTQDQSRKTQDYWQPIKSFLDYLKFKLPHYNIVIAAHHRRNKYDIPIKGYKFIFDNTSETIKNSKLVLCHNSFASQIAVLFKKPIIFLSSDYYQTYHFTSHLIIKELSKALGTEYIYIKKKFQPNYSIINKVKSAKSNFTKYDSHKRNFIHFPGNKSYGTWKSLLKQLDYSKVIN